MNREKGRRGDQKERRKQKRRKNALRLDALSRLHGEGSVQHPSSWRPFSGRL
jgi:hypothetical protein